MIKATELRIGNKVDTIVGRMTVKAIFKNGDDRFNIGFDEYGQIVGLTAIKGISLTEEWLERMGFVHKFNYNADGDEVNWMEYERKDVIGNNYLCYKDGQINLFHGQLNITPCSCVHDLQNLYFALTGVELTIKP